MWKRYEKCVEEGYTADEYANEWAEKLRDSLFKESFKYYLRDNPNLSDEDKNNLRINESLSDKCLDFCYGIIKETYESYEAERETLLLELDGNYDYDFDNEEESYESYEAERETILLFLDRDFDDEKEVNSVSLHLIDLLHQDFNKQLTPPL